MSLSAGQRKGGRPNVQSIKPRTSFKWTKELHMKMAEYLKENYQSYRVSLSSSRKMEYLRRMRETLEFNCDDKQIRNGFMNFLKKYDDVKKKLNASGFGIDPDKDSTLNKGWILKMCPYFDLLDEVMGSRPNVSPPAVISTSIFNNGNLVEVEMSSTADFNDSCMYEDLNSVAMPAVTNQDEIIDVEETTSLPPESDVSKFVKNAVKHIEKPKKAKCPMSMFSEVMSQKLEMKAEVEKEKMKSEESRFKIELEMQKERIRIEEAKVEMHREIEKEKIKLEREKMAEKEAERLHELEKLKLQQEFELKKMELELKRNI